jgi:hypothetical protein
MDFFSDRVSAVEVEEILRCIVAPPNRRETPTEGDLQGEFDFWFDGGAYLPMTGSSEYVFANGIRARVAGPVPWLNIEILFPDGRRVDIQQRSGRHLSR